jgi:hypothetical protein
MLDRPMAAKRNMREYLSAGESENMQVRIAKIFAGAARMQRCSIPLGKSRRQDTQYEKKRHPGNHEKIHDNGSQYGIFAIRIPFLHAGEHIWEKIVREHVPKQPDDQKHQPEQIAGEQDVVHHEHEYRDRQHFPWADRIPNGEIPGSKSGGKCQREGFHHDFRRSENESQDHAREDADKDEPEIGKVVEHG